MPQFPGGEAALLKYVATHLKYPAIAMEQEISGVVTLRFVVLEDGSFLGCDESCGVVDAASSEVVVQICISLPLYVDDEFDNN